MTRRAALLGLCATGIVSWGVLYYTFPVLLGTVLRDTGWSAGAAMGAFSTGLVASALCGPFVGRWVDRSGPRVVMTTGSVLGVLGLLAVAKAPSLPLFFAAWILTGAAQAMLLYQPAFAALTRWYGTERVRALTAVSLVGGLASTVFAPIADGLLTLLGWRGCLLVLACLLGAVTLPVHFWCLRLPWPPDRRRADGASGDHVRTVARSPAFWSLVCAMVLAGFGMYAATVNLVPLFTSRGESNTTGAIALALCGAGQLLGRLGYGRFSARFGPGFRTVAVLALGALMTALLAVVSGPAALVMVLGLGAGAVRGVYTLLQATAVSDRWGTARFGTLNGLFSAPLTLAIALAPFGGTGLATLFGGYGPAFVILAALVALGALFAASGRVRHAGAASG